MATKRIQDLEVAEELLNDMLIPVAGLNKTQSAQLSQVRAFLNKYLVEKENQNFNDLTDDGFYQCIGTSQNAPVGQMVTWAVSVVKDGAIIVQTAYSTDATSTGGNYPNTYKRRFNGVSWSNWKEVSGVKTGSLMPFAGDTTPSGWLRCDGSAISRTEYANLYAVIGTKYGSGDGSSTFNIPNFVNRTFWGGLTSGAYLDGTLPNITGTVGNLGRTRGAIFTGAFYDAGNNGDVDYSNVIGAKAGFDASRSSSKYKNGALVRPESIQTMILIKY